MRLGVLLFDIAEIEKPLLGEARVLMVGNARIKGLA